MSAVLQPNPDPEPPERARTGSDDDGWALLEALRRRLDDQAAQGRKTQVQVGQLADSIAALVSEQRHRSKWLNLNSFVAYVIFTVVVGAGFYVLYRSRSSELLEARNAARHERDLATKRADDATAKVAAREAADTTAWEAYQLLEAGKRTDAAAKLATVGPQALSRTERAVLAARAHETAIMEVDAALKTAAVSFKAGRHGDVIAPLEAALVGEPTGARRGTIHYFLGVAYAKTNDLARAMGHLQLAVTTDTEHLDARFQLASALDRGGHFAKARAEYDQFATAYPQSGLAVFAMRRSATLARTQAAAPNAVEPTTAPTSPSTKGAPTPTPPTTTAPSPTGAPAKTGPGTTPTGAATTPTMPPGAAMPAPTTGAPTMPTTPAGAAPTTPAGAAPTTPAPTGAKPPGAAPAPKWAPKKPALPAPAKPTPTPVKPAAPAPKPVDEPAPSEGSATTNPMSTTPFDLREGMSIAEGPAIDRERPARRSPSPAIDDAPRERAPTELPPRPTAGTPAPSLPPAPSVDRAPAPTHEPPVDRAPAPAPRTPPRADVTPPHER
ncbi:MAG: tetratricopeptide repeat protein [Kofleriaceae bacterium]